MKILMTLLALAMTACTPQIALTAPPAASGATQPSAGFLVRAGTVVLNGRRAFAAAELGYITAAKGVGLLADNGIITGSVATAVRGYNADARRLLVAGKATSDTIEQARIAAQLFGITDRLDAIRGSN